MSVDRITRDEADHLARRVVETRKLSMSPRARAERRAERWRKRYMQSQRKLREARATIDALTDELERLQA